MEEGRRRRLRLAALGLGAALLLGAAFWFGHAALLGSGDAHLPVVAAPEGDYKVAPEDPGGLTVGHDDVSIYDALVRGRPGAVPEAVGPLPEAPRPVLPAPSADPPEQAALAPTGKPEPVPAMPTPRPAPRGRLAAAAPSAPAPPAATPEKPPEGVAVELGAYGTESAARAAWAELRQRHADLLGRMEAAFVAGGGRVRVRAGPVSTPVLAEIVCEQLKARDVGCLILQ